MWESRVAQLDKAAIFRVEGTLVKAPNIPAPAYFTMNVREMTRRVTRLSGWALATGLKLASPLKDQQVVHKVAWMGLRGMSEDRLIILGEEFYARHILPNLRDVGMELVKEAKRQGHRIILISDLLGCIVAPLKDHLGADVMICNTMEVDHGAATGKLETPVIGGPLSGQWAKTWAAEHAIDLDQSFAYGAQGSDSILLSAIGKPCAVFPDRRLRRIAKDLDWPIVEG
ncbi:MAG: putative phosphoserine phosphatase/1-acylglycerol-3-phosphate O-acyltransferase [Myxococcota bacterium]|jgi:putative phosphoserine phosphatase/1-acylglycerol-3-phosphate O-acyltransferase